MNISGGRNRVVRFSAQPPEEGKQTGGDKKPSPKTATSLDEIEDKFFVRPKTPDKMRLSVPISTDTSKQLDFLAQFRMSDQEEVVSLAMKIIQRLDQLRMKGHSFKLAMIKHTPKPNPNFRGEDWLTIYDLDETKRVGKMDKVKKVFGKALGAISSNAKAKRTLVLPFTNKDTLELQHLTVARRTTLPNLVADAIDVLYRATQAKIDNPALRFEMYGDKREIQERHYTADAYHLIEIDNFPLPGSGQTDDSDPE